MPNLNLKYNYRNGEALRPAKLNLVKLICPYTMDMHTYTHICMEVMFKIKEDSSCSFAFLGLRLRLIYFTFGHSYL
jgi:hypothetical protein